MSQCCADVYDKTKFFRLDGASSPVFTSDSIYAIARIYATPIPSVRPSVCHTRVLYQNG